jgi:hypothetical protein
MNDEEIKDLEVTIATAKIMLSQERKKLAALEKLSIEVVPDKKQRCDDQMAVISGQLATIKDLELQLKEGRLLVKQEESLAKQEDKEIETDDFKWQQFVQALKIYDDTQMCFLQGSQPCYFRKVVHTSIRKKSNSPVISVKLEKYPVGSLPSNWMEFESKTCLRYFKKMVRGDEIVIKDPETNSFINKVFPKRQYTGMVNTLDTPDPNTYNIIDLSDSMHPNEFDEQPPCPPVMAALMIALSGGCAIIGKDGKFKSSRPVVTDWLERWIYAVVHADIGNNFLSMPIMFGKGKKGKNVLFDLTIPTILGKNQCFTAVWDTVDSNFNGFKLGKVFIYIDEIPSKEDWTKIKSLTGSTNDYVKEKYGLEYSIDNCIAMAMGSNQVTFPLPVEDGNQMMRVSPINLNRGDTFAEVVYKVFNSITPNVVEDTLVNDFGTDLSKYPTEFDKGDTFLRRTEHLWGNKESIQQFLDYLHHKHKPKAGAQFSLEPLRDTDWVEMLNNKPNPITATVQYILDRKVDKISALEVYEIYKVLASSSGNSSSSQFVKTPANLVAEMAPRFESEGFITKHRQRVKADGMSRSTQTTVWYKDGVDVRGYKCNVSDYVDTIMVGGDKTRNVLVQDDEPLVTEFGYKIV